MDDISDPQAPFPLQTFVFLPDEIPEAICTSPDQDKLIVLLQDLDPTPQYELRIYDYATPGLLLDEVTPPAVAPWPGGAPACGTSFNRPLRARVERIQLTEAGVVVGEATVALVAAIVLSPGCGPPSKPHPAGLLVCNVEDPAAPFFYGTEPGGNLALQSWDPCRTGGPCGDWRINGFDHVRTTGANPRDLVYVAGGTSVLLQELDVTEVADPLVGIVVNAGPVALAPLDALHAVFVDPAAPASDDYLYVVGQNTVHVVRRRTVATTVDSVPGFAQFGNGPAGDSLMMLESIAGTDHRTIWTLAQDNAPHVFRVTDFTQDGLPGLDPPDSSEGYYGAGPVDGAVANFAWESAYVSTFGGVVRWDVSGTDPIPNPNPHPSAGSYQPAQTAGGQSFLTEHLELEDLGATSADWHLLAPTAEGRFFSWPIDPTTYDPLPGDAFGPASPVTYWSWAPGSQPVYGNDVAAWTHPTTGDHWILIDHAKLGAPELRIGRFDWSDPISVGWAPAIVCDDPSPGVLPNVTGYARDLAVDGDHALLAAEGGFVVVDLVAGIATDWVYTDAVGPGALSFSAVFGIEKHGNRIFASLGDTTNRYAVAMYAFDETTGQVVHPVTGLQTDAPMQVLFDGASGSPDDFPGVFLDEGARMSLLEVESDPDVLRLYAGSSKGPIVELAWDETSDTLAALATWHNGNLLGTVNDCNAYLVPVVDSTSFGSSGFGPTPPPQVPWEVRVVVAKTPEAFEIVRSTTWS